MMTRELVGYLALGVAAFLTSFALSRVPSSSPGSAGVQSTSISRPGGEPVASGASRPGAQQRSPATAGVAAMRSPPDESAFDAALRVDTAATWRAINQLQVAVFDRDLIARCGRPTLDTVMELEFDVSLHAGRGQARLATAPRVLDGEQLGPSVLECIHAVAAGNYELVADDIPVLASYSGRFTVPLVLRAREQ